MSDDQLGIPQSLPTGPVAPAWLGPAVLQGHDLVPDPSNLTLAQIATALRVEPERLAGARRWTCRHCAATALQGRAVPYGSAFERSCRRRELTNGWANVPSWPGWFAGVTG